MNLSKLERVLVFPDHRCLVVVDSTKTANILYIDQPNSDFDQFYKATGQHRAEEAKSIHLELAVMIKLRNIQQIDCSELSLLDILVIDNHTLFFLTTASILVLTRPKLKKDEEKLDVESMLKRSPKRRKSQVEETPESIAKKIEEAKYPFHEFSHTATLKLSYENDCRKPQFLTRLDKHLMSLVYDDGFVDIIQFSSYLTCRNPEKRQSQQNLYETMVVSSFLITFNSSLNAKTKNATNLSGSQSNGGVVRKVVAASQSNTYGKEGYAAEFFTVDKDFHIIHWGLRPLSLYSDAFDGYSIASTNVTQSLDDGSVKSGGSSIVSQREAAKEPIVDENQQEPYIESLDLIHIHFIATQQPQTQRMLPDFLGDVQLHNEAKVNPAVATSKPGYGTIHLSFMELRNSDNKPVSKHLVGSYDGMIMLFEIRQPYLAIREWSSSSSDKRASQLESAGAQELHNKIFQAVRGPDMSSADDHFVTEQEGIESNDSHASTILLVKKGQMDLLSMKNGNILRSYPLYNLREQLHLRNNSDSKQNSKFSKSLKKSVTKGRLADDLTATNMERDLEGEVTFVHFCPYTHWIFVGYTSGTIGAFVMNAAGVQDVDLGFSYLKSNTIHSNSISYLRTFPFLYNHELVTDHLDPIKPKHITVLFVGDASGQFTLWQVHPKRTGQKALCFQSHQHMGRICSATVCYVPHGKITHDFASVARNKFHNLNSNHNILITACEKGLVHAWRMEQNLQLHLISFFHTSRFPLRMTSCLALPKMIYREFLVPNPDASESMFSSLLEDPNKDRNPEYQGVGATKVTIEDNGGRKTAASTYLQKDASAFIPMANLCYEVYCILGYSDGKTEIWSLSSDPRYCTSYALYSRKLVDSPITSLSLYCPDIHDGIAHEPAASIMQEFTLINIPKLEGEDVSHHSYHIKPDDVFISAHRNGAVSVSRLIVNPLFSVEEYTRVRETDDFSKRFFVEVLSYFQCPSKSIVSVVPLQPNHLPIGTSDYDIAIVSDFGVYEVLPMISKHQLIPSQWHQNAGRLGEEHERGGKTVKPYRPTRLSTNDILSLQSGAPISLHGVTNVIPQSIEVIVNHHALFSRFDTSSSAASALQLTDTTPTTMQEVLQDMLDQPGSFRGSLSLSQNRGNASRGPNVSIASDCIDTTGTGSLEAFGNQQDGSVTANSGLSGSTASKNRRQYIGPMETMQRIVSSDLHIAKKDKRLLELFTFEMDPRESAVTADTAIDIISQWIQENRHKILKSLPQQSETSTEVDIRRENLQDLFQMLEVHPDSRLKFIEVAKLAALTASAMRKAAEINWQKSQSNGIADNGGGLSMSASAPALRTYQQMKTTVTKVTYNSMGERVVEKKKREKNVMGLVDGSYTELRKTIYDHVALQKKIEHDVKVNLTDVVKISRKLQSIPSPFQDILQPQRLPLRCPDDPDPAYWNEKGLHYLDVARTIKIARAIFDLRSGKQHEIVHDQKSAQTLFSANPNSVDSLPKLTILYFERLFGECSRSMNVSRHKISNFLEACLQYEYFPLLKLLQYMNHLDEDYAASPGFEVGIWLAIEARDILFSRGSVIHGEAIDKYEKISIREIGNDGKILKNFNITGEPASRVVRFHYVTPIEANMVTDELLRVRGGFGPEFYIPILEEISRIPTKTRKQVLSDHDPDEHVDAIREEKGMGFGSNDSVREEDKLIDLEGYLEELFRLFVVHAATLKGLDNRLFREANLNVAVTAISREISRSKTSSRILIMDDDTAGFGACHVSNVDKIRKFLHCCIQKDPMRTGTITEDEFLANSRKIFLSPVSHDTIPQLTFATEDFPSSKCADQDSEQEKIMLYRFFHAVQSRLKLNSVQDDTSYVDILALLFSWEEATQGMSPMTIDNMLPVIPTLERLVEFYLINDLLRYVTKTSKYENVIENPLWIMRSRSSLVSANPYFAQTMGREEQKDEPKLALSLPMDGEWHINIKPAENDHLPGMLHAAPAPRIKYHSHTLSAVTRLYHRQPYSTRSWFAKDGLPLPPQVMTNMREMSSAVGETVGLNVTKAPVAIRTATLDNAFNQLRPASSQALIPSHGLSTPSSRDIRTSYSRLLSTMQVIPADVSVASPAKSSNASANDIPFDAGLEKIHEYLLNELNLDGETANAAIKMIMEQFHSQQQSPSPDWQRTLWSLLTSQFESAAELQQRPRSESLNDSIPGDDDPVEKSMIDQSLSELLLQGSSEGNGGIRPDPVSGEDDDDIDDELGARDLPYKLLRQNSSNSTDSNYQEYALEMHQQQLQRQDVDQVNKNDNDSTNSAAKALPPITRRPVTNEFAALTPFLDFKESDFPPPSAVPQVSDPLHRSNPVTNFLISSSLQELLQFQDPNASKPAAPYHGGSTSLLSTSLNFPGQSLSEVNRSLASDEIHRRILHLQELEEKFASAYEREKDEYKKRELEKQRLREMIRREMLLKERESMKYYRNAMSKRSKFLAAGRAQLAEAIAKEMEDKHAKESEIQHILEINRERLHQRQEQKKMNALAQTMKDREETERVLMQKEEKLTMKIELAVREEKRKKAAAEKAKADAEWAEQLKAMQEIGEEDLRNESIQSHGRKIKSREGDDAEDEDTTERRPTSGNENDDANAEGSSSGNIGGLFGELMKVDDGGMDEDEDDDNDEDGMDEEADEDKEDDEDFSPSTADNTRPSTSLAAAAMHFFKASSVDGGEIDSKEEILTPIEKRIRLLLANMKNGALSQQTHPRKDQNPKQSFFFPQAFSADIVFNPFQNISDEIAQRFVSPDVREVDPEELNPVEVIFDPFTMSAPIETDLFGDINAAVTKYRKELDVERRSLLNTKLGDIKLEEFLPVFRTGFIDWQNFFRVEKKRLKVMKQRMIAAAEQEARAFDFDPDDFSAMLQSLQDGGGSSPSNKDSSIMDMISLDGSASSLLGPNFGQGRPLRRQSTAPFELKDLEGYLSPDDEETSNPTLQHIPKTILQVLPKDPKRDIVPLPFGKVKEKQIAFPGQLKFYQMEVPFLDTIVSVELKCSRGLASMYLHYNKLPSTVKFEEKASCTKESNRWARLSFHPKVTGTYFLAVTSLDSGAEFEIWAYSTGESKEINPHLHQVDQILKKWKFILQHSDEELQIHYPRINQEAKKQSEDLFKEQEHIMHQKKQVIREMKKVQEEGKLNEILSKPPLSLDEHAMNEEQIEDIVADMENVEAFVVKVGRYAMRREREMKQYKQMLLAKSNPPPNDNVSLASNSQDSQDSNRGLSEDKKPFSTNSHEIHESIDVQHALSAATKASLSGMEHLVPGIIPEGETHQPTVSSHSAIVTIPEDGLISDSLLHSPQLITKFGASSTGKDDEEGVFANENPNQHADLFSTPSSHRVASMAMFAPVPQVDLPLTGATTSLASISLHLHAPHHGQGGRHVGSSSHTSVNVHAKAAIPEESIDTFQEELQRVMTEEIAVSHEKVASHTNFALPALRLKYKGSDMHFEKDFHSNSPKVPTVAHTTNNSATSTASQIPKLPPILQALKDRLTDSSEAQQDSETALDSRGLANDDKTENSNLNANVEQENIEEEEAEEEKRIKALMMSATMPTLQQHMQLVHGRINGNDGDERDRPLQYSFSVADIRENRRREKMRLKMLPPELRSTPKPVSYDLHRTERKDKKPNVLYK